MLLKLNFTFALFLFFMPLQALALGGSETCVPIKLKQKELHSVFKLIKYPKPSLKNRSWKANSCYISDPKYRDKHILIESSYYEQGADYDRYYENLCGFYKSWKCEQRDIFRLKKSGEKIRLKFKTSAVEVLRLIDYVSKIDFSSIRDVLPNGKMNIDSLIKEKDNYYVFLKGKDTHCSSIVEISSTENNGFRTGKLATGLCE